MSNEYYGTHELNVNLMASIVYTFQFGPIEKTTNYEYSNFPIVINCKKFYPKGVKCCIQALLLAEWAYYGVSESERLL